MHGGISTSTSGIGCPTTRQAINEKESKIPRNGAPTLIYHSKHTLFYGMSLALGCPSLHVKRRSKAFCSLHVSLCADVGRARQPQLDCGMSSDVKARRQRLLSCCQQYHLVHSPYTYDNYRSTERDKLAPFDLQYKDTLALCTTKTNETTQNSSQIHTEVKGCTQDHTATPDRFQPTCASESAVSKEQAAVGRLPRDGDFLADVIDAEAGDSRTILDVRQRAPRCLHGLRKRG